MTGDVSNATAHVISYDATNKMVKVIWLTGSFDKREAVTFVGGGATTKIARSEIELIQDFIDSAKNLIDKYCHTQFGDNTLTGSYQDKGHGEPDRIFLNDVPVVSVSSFSVNGTALVLDTTYWLTDKGKDRGYIDVKQGQIEFDYSNDPDHVDISYVWGTSSVPDGIRQACIEICVNPFEDYKRFKNIGGADKMSMADFSVTFTKRVMLSEENIELLKPHRRRRMVAAV